MKITKTQLKKIIKEEIAKVTKEGLVGDPIFPAGQEVDQGEVELLVDQLGEISERLAGLADQFAPALGLPPAEAYGTLVDFLSTAIPEPEPEVDFTHPEVAVAEQ